MPTVKIVKNVLVRIYLLRLNCMFNGQDTDTLMRVPSSLCSIKLSKSLMLQRVTTVIPRQCLRKQWGNAVGVYRISIFLSTARNHQVYEYW